VKQNEPLKDSAKELSLKSFAVPPYLVFRLFFDLFDLDSSTVIVVLYLGVLSKRVVFFGVLVLCW